MSKKSLFVIVGIMLAAIVTSLTLVFTIGPKINAARGYWSIYLNDESDFVINEGVLTDLSNSAKETIRQKAQDYYVPIRIEIPTSVTKIGSGAFTFQVGSIGATYAYIDEIRIPESVKIICSNAFTGCNYISRITIPGSVEEIGEYAFRGCSSLTWINVQEGVQNIGARAFAIIGGHSLSIYLPNSVVSIGEGAFSGDSKLDYFSLPQNVQVIGDRAFTNCSKLGPWFRIPSSVVEIGENVFDGCTDITAILVENREMLNHSNLRVYQERGILHCAKNTVTFDANGGSDVPTEVVSYGSNVNVTTEPIKEGYRFTGWFLNGEKFNVYNTPVTDDITLTAQWEEIPTIMNESNPNGNVSLIAWVIGSITAIASVIGAVVRVIIKKRLK